MSNIITNSGVKYTISFVGNYLRGIVFFDSNTALMKAAEGMQGNHPAVQLLLSAGADINQRNKNG